MRGLTLIEVVLVVAIAVVVLASTTALLGGNTARSAVEAKAAETVSLISRARDNARAGYLSDHWGIRVLDNSSDCANNGLGSGDCIVMYKGNSYSGRNAIYDKKVYLQNGVYINTSEQNDFYFTFNVGWLASSTVGNLSEQAIILSHNSGSLQRVSTTPFGLVYYGD